MLKRLVKVGAFYLLTVVVLTVYGIEVCPFLEQLTPLDLAAILTGAFVISGVIRYFIFKYLQRNRPGEQCPADLEQPWNYLRIDLGLWLLAGLLVMVWNFSMYDFPVVSGLKVVLGCLTLGIFSATYLALDVEGELIRYLAKEGNLEELRTAQFFSITTKFMVFLGASVGVITGVILLLIYKDFTYVIQALSNQEPFQFSWVVKEVLFVSGLLLAGCFAVARKYSGNLRLMFDLQMEAFGAVEKGNYDTFVPVVSNDEFSMIAEQTNQMIVGLRERERIKRAFGKYMSPTVAQTVLSNEQETNLGGREVEVAVLFTDLRNFTPLSERCTPQEVVGLLNEYFSMVVETVHRHGGVLDKFIGDAAMAVFGLDEGGNACEDAVQTAFEIRQGLEVLNRRFAARGLPEVRNGVGVHFGVVVAGNIGCEQRLEYTVIGDAVNTASRLESLTKELPSVIAISETVYERLGVELRDGLIFVGEHDLKGKSGKIPVYGLSQKTAA